jgi:hypothetical protein
LLVVSTLLFLKSFIFLKGWNVGVWKGVMLMMMIVPSLLRVFGVDDFDWEEETEMSLGFHTDTSLLSKGGHPLQRRENGPGTLGISGFSIVLLQQHEDHAHYIKLPNNRV